MPGPEELVTPCLVVEATRLQRNLAGMARAARAAGVALRPHAKTHKCVTVARRQLGLGAAGLTVATVGEAEVFADGGCQDLFVAYPVWPGSGRLDRLRALRDRARVLVGADSTAACAALGPLSAGPDPLEVLVEVDCGQHRSGVAPADVVPVARAAVDAGLAVAGVFSFPGHGYAPGAAAGAAAEEGAALGAAVAAMADAGFPCPVVSGGSTPTALRSLDQPGPLTELRPGVYAFGDAQQVALGTTTLDRVALWAAATVVSVPAPDRAVLDAGSKALGADRPPWLPGFGIVPELGGAWVAALSEHHAVVPVPPGGRPPVVGQRVTVVPAHVCSAVNLADELVVVSGEAVVDRWRVDARGANR